MLVIGVDFKHACLLSSIMDSNNTQYCKKCTAYAMKTSIFFAIPPKCPS